MPTLSPLAPGRVSPRLSVPGHIARPEYVDRPSPAPFTGSEIKDAETIEAMRVAGRLAAQALALCGSMVRPGVTTDAIDRAGHEFLLDHGAYPSTLGYRGFPKSLCTSINEVVCHGIPDDRELRDGDILNIDVTCYVDGVHGDNSMMFLVGDVDPERRRLVEVTDGGDAGTVGLFGVADSNSQYVTVKGQRSIYTGHCHADMGNGGLHDQISKHSGPRSEADERQDGYGNGCQLGR